MKHLNFIAATFLAALFIATSCSTNELDSVERENFNEVKELTVNFGGDFTISTRATSSVVPNDLFIVDYMDNEEVQFIHLMGSEDKLNPTITLPYGYHTLYFLLSYAERPNVDRLDNIVRWTIVNDTFWKKIDIYVDDRTSSTLEITLDRVVTKLKVTSIDKVPENGDFIIGTLSKWYDGINYLTGQPIECYAPNKQKIWYIGSNWEYANLESYSFADTEEFTTDINFCTHLKDGSTIESVVTNVPFKRNRVTSLHGKLFTRQEEHEETSTGNFNGGFGIKLNNVWIGTYDMTW